MFKKNGDKSICIVWRLWIVTNETTNGNRPNWFYEDYDMNHRPVVWNIGVNGLDHCRCGWKTRFSHYLWNEPYDTWFLKFKDLHNNFSDISIHFKKLNCGGNPDFGKRSSETPLHLSDSLSARLAPPTNVAAPIRTAQAWNALGSGRSAFDLTGRKASDLSFSHHIAYSYAKFESA